MCQRVEGETKLVNEKAKNWVALQKNLNNIDYLFFVTY